MLARSILALTNAVVVMDLGERLLLAHNLKTGLDLGQLVKEHAQSLGGKGGGSAGTAQVFFADPSQRSRFLDLLQVLLIGD
jgi:alanyl-tRNA synthetase